MSEDITITISKSNNNTVIGKVIVLILLSCFTGYLFTLSKATDFDEGQKLTLEQYTAEFEHHKAKLTKKPKPLWVGIAIFGIFSFFTFGLYELLGGFLGMIVGKVRRRSEARNNAKNSS